VRPFIRRQPGRESVGLVCVCVNVGILVRQDEREYGTGSESARQPAKKPHTPAGAA